MGKLCKCQRPRQTVCQFVRLFLVFNSSRHAAAARDVAWKIKTKSLSPLPPPSLSLSHLRNLALLRTFSSLPIGVNPTSNEYTYIYIYIFFSIFAKLQIVFHLFVWQFNWYLIPLLPLVRIIYTISENINWKLQVRSLIIVINDILTIRVIRV